jgi:hypothetical protein
MNPPEPLQNNNPVEQDKLLIFHLPHHLRGITRQQVHDAYLEIVGPLIPEQQLLIAVSQPHNI